MSPRNSDEAWQHDLADDGIVDTPLFGIRLVIVATALRHDEVVRGKDVQALAAPADAARPGLPALRHAGGGSAEIPVIAVAEPTLDRDHRGRHALHPIRRHDLATVPDSAGEHELADLQHVARQQAQARGGAILAVPALGPRGG